MPQPLSSKDHSLFRQVIKNYDAKQYKKGLKAADQILRKNPTHGDTLAMKALLINTQGKTDEAFVLAKEALKQDMKSHVCWHVYGLLWRAVKNYEEAIKAYKFALRLEPDSAQIQRDLALLQMQMRDFPGYIQSRKAMLQARPHFRQNWTAMAIAHHLAGNLTEAESYLKTYEDTLKTPPPKTDIEHSEAVLYKNTIIAEMGEYERALEHLDTISKNNLDRTAVMEMKASYLLKLGRMEDAEKAYRALLKRNAEYRAYYYGLEQAIGTDRKNTAELKKLYDGYAEKNPRGDAAYRIPLDFLEGDEFREAADAYLKRMLTKGAPSTFANVKALYSDIAKRDVICELVEGYVSGEANATANGSAKELSEKVSEELSEKIPEVSEKVAKNISNGDVSRSRLAALYFLAQHYNYHLSRDLSKAMEYIEKAIELSPESAKDNVDYNMTKARIWKHYGNTQKASETMEHARTLDEKDRYINTKAAKYQLRNDENETALKTMSKFTRNETIGGPLGDLHEMQCMWYITEDGESYLRQQKLGLALKRFKAIYDIFDTWQEDQFDFHSFSLRKGQIRAYVDMVRWEDSLREHPFYSRVAIKAIRTYILLHDHPELVHGPLPNGVDGADLSKLDAAGRKKAMKKAKKEQQKLEKEKAEAEEAKRTSKTAVGADGEIKKEDPDPQGTQLLQTSEPLKEAMKFLTPLLDFSPKLLEAELVGFELFIRRQKYLLALKCLLAASKLDPESPVVHEQTIRFRHTLDTLSTPLEPRVAEVIASEFSLLPTSTNLTEHNDAFLARHKDSAPHIHAFLRIRFLLSPESKVQNEKDLHATLGLSTIDQSQAVEGLKLLDMWKAETSVKDQYRKAATERWPEASAFQS
ncbi:MAG: hypothetical protein M1819_000233 [Sarea resinae]|nr:MAG: hypothetical protein M1819_000233 [Sarea resinae]